jgi:hypothetical protein
MGIDFDGFWLDRNLQFGTYTYYEPQWPNIYPEAFILNHTVLYSNTEGIHRIAWTPIIIPNPVFYDGFFLDIKPYITDGNIERLEYIPIVLPIPVFYSGVMIYHWVDPVRSTAGDDAYFIIRNIPPPVLDFGASAHVTFVNRKTRFYNNSTGDVFSWDFGDGGGSNRREPFHYYRKAGTYTVKLSIDGFWYTSPVQVIVFENNYILDTGAVFLNYGEKNAVCLGATEGGNAFGIENDFRYMSFDGEAGAVAGGHRLVGSTPKIVANMIEINYRLLNIVLPGSNVTFASGAATIKRAIRRLLESDYIQNIAIVAEHGGTGAFIVFKIKNAVTIENIEIPFEDGSESVVTCTFSGCFTPDTIDSEPWEIDFVIA